MKYEDELIDESVMRKLKILSFFEKHGLAPTVDAYNISRSTIYRWKKLLKDNNGKIEVLKDRSKIPKNKRKRETDLRIIDYIVMIRKKYPRMGKDKIKVLLDEQCKDSDIKPISSSTIGRIIKERNLFFYPKEYTHKLNNNFYEWNKKIFNHCS